MKHWVFVDLDLTLCDTLELVKSGGPEPKDPRSAEHGAWVHKVTDPAVLAAAPPVHGVLNFVRVLEEQWRTSVVFLTNRREELREVTQTWLRKYDLPQLLMMRPTGHLEPSGKFKASVIAGMVRMGEFVTIVDDDPDGSVEIECRQRGWTHLKPTTYPYSKSII